MGGMHWRNFVVFNVLGGITWSTVFTLLGYFFGGIPFVQEHFELLIIGIVAVSIIPTVVGLVKAKLGKKERIARAGAQIVSLRPVTVYGGGPL